MDLRIRQHWTRESVRPLDTPVLMRSVCTFRRALAALDTSESALQARYASDFRHGLSVMEAELRRRQTETVPSDPSFPRGVGRHAADSRYGATTLRKV